MRTVDADAIISRIKPLIEAERQIFKKASWNFAEKCLTVVESTPTVSAEPQWIPCSKRLPYVVDGTSGVVLATCGSKNVKDTSIRWVRRLWFDGEYWNTVEGERYKQIVYAWMPQPKPYKEGKNE